ncbi:hypothetical protein Vretimale_18556 [Volvox reticuliferus]|uniref:Uncharacterized protein n=1 Tax=Volvox reticuliferus TaxID=1737510 RepID=A0A8J4GV86_9CHLO|nr:hypothetical protein Vretifemale_19637 [Volvox reticuliferus]GIL91943.1 hypothetical protein Vretifemale_19637 [Volvox reticuliferus]GIM15875.1 hypothetical protein Vretimale_18556 [Volvox reticuliferus]GIM15877.1 hypothetical protein Vretimale_18556 [Volvox reticuliferus]
MATNWLVDGWQQRTQQKLAFAGCMAALLSLRNDPLRTASRFRDFAHKVMGYGGAAIIFSGIQETCRAVRGRHDFLNSAISGAVTGALVVGHYQGPKYRFLGVVTWGSLGAVLHIANAVLQPRYHFEEYLIREGLLSPEAARYRRTASLPKSSESGLLFPEYEHRDVLIEARAIRDRELRQINERLAHARTGSTSTPNGEASKVEQDYDDEEGLADDDPAYQAWLRTSGFQADALLSQSQQLQQQPGSSNSTAITTSNPMDSRVSDTSQQAISRVSEPGAGGKNAAATVTAPAVNGSSWSIWVQPWKWRSRKVTSGGAGNAEGQERSN